MARLFAVILLIMLCATALAACEKENKAEESTAAETGEAASSEAEAEDEVWDVFESVNCQKHHKDYHLIPYNLVKQVGIDESNEWAKKVKENLSEDTDENTCSCPDFNIKKYIEDFDIPREDFIAYGDLIYYGTYDADLIYGSDMATLDEYFIYSEALIDKTIKSQHFSFIQTHFKYEYSSEVYDMVVYDDALGAGMLPSIPTIVQALNIDIGTFEKILEECTERNEAVYGRSYNFDYDLGIIYGEDGSFRELPELEGLTEYEREMKLDRIFCGIDE